MGHYRRVEEAVTAWMWRHGPPMARVSLGVIFLWFGLPKILGLSPVDDLIGSTVPFIPPGVFIPALGAVQVMIGLGFFFRPLLRVALILFFLHLPGTMLPLVLLPDLTFTQFPFSPTIEGQYVLKNLVLAAAGVVVAGTLYREGGASRKVRDG